MKSKTHSTISVSAVSLLFFQLDLISCLLLATLSFTLLFISIIIIRCRYSSTLPLPPGPKPWPLIGCIPQMLLNKPTFKWIHAIMKEVKSNIICIRLGKVHVIAVSSPEIAREFLKTHDTIFSSRPNFMSTHLTTDGYLTAIYSPSGQQYKKMKSVLISHILSPAQHSWLYNKRASEADHLVNYIYNQSGSQPTSGGLVNVRVASQHYCGNVIRQMLFSKRFFGTGAMDGGPGKEEIEQIDGLFTMLKYINSFCISDYLPILRWVVDLDGHESIMRKAIKSVMKYQDPEVDARIIQWNNGTRMKQEDLLDVLIELQDKNGKPLLSGDEIKAQIIEIMIATVDNPSNACECALAEMINKPNMLQIATEELDRVIGRNRQVQESDIPNLNYIKACIREAFRLHPIAPFNVPHMSTQDTEVAGYFIPKGSHVLLSRSALGRNGDVWENPLIFDPQRHLENEGAKVVLTDNQLNMLSFSTGRRGCIGVRLGSTMSIMLLATLLHGFTWHLPPNEPSIDLSESYGDMLKAKPLIVLAKARLPPNLYLSTYNVLSNSVCARF